MSSVDMSRRMALGALSCTMMSGWLTACARVPIFHQAYATLDAPLQRGDRYPVTAEAVAKSPYASLGAQFEGQPKAVMTLATVSADERLDWVSSNRVVLTTQRAHLVATQGLPIDLQELRMSQEGVSTTLLPGQLGPLVMREQRSGPPGKEAAWVEVRSRYRNLGETRIEILGTTRVLWLIEEQADYRDWRWRTVNRYWIDPATGFAWRSVQSYTPEIAAVTLEVLKPYGSG